MTVDTWNEIQPNYLHVHCQGAFEIEAMLKVISMAFDHAGSKGLNSILVDVMEVLGRPPTTMERYRLGEHVAQLFDTYGRHFRFAMVGNAPMIEPARFGETVARNRGANILAFNAIEDAIAWFERSGDEDAC